MVAFTEIIDTAHVPIQIFYKKNDMNSLNNLFIEMSLPRYCVKNKSIIPDSMTGKGHLTDKRKNKTEVPNPKIPKWNLLFASDQKHLTSN
jgi:hypothetical protein